MFRLVAMVCLSANRCFPSPSITHDGIPTLSKQMVVSVSLTSPLYYRHSAFS